MNALETDVLVLGAGAAGLVTALNAHWRRVTVLVPDDAGSPTTAASDLAQGGIAAAVASDDSPQQHLEDTFRAGGRRVDVTAARYVCERAFAAIGYLESLGVPFDRTGREYSLHTEAAHRCARVLHVGDSTGAAIMRSLRDAALNASHVEFLLGMRAVQLLVEAGRVCGVVAVGEHGQALAIHARAVVIATGGLGGLYARTTNPVAACGDGPAMALAAGARCGDLEFVQFHPTALNVEAGRLPLLTEALRGAGAMLIDENGRRILEGIHPLAELAPRDVVARAVFEVQRCGRVALDATRIRHSSVAASFPLAWQACMDHGFDLEHEPVPVTPAAHYHMGGICVDLDGRASLPGLWAVGEAACTGVHGANRLASNSLLEAIVFGRRCGRVLSTAGREPSVRCREIQSGVALAAHAAPRELREMLWRCMGVVRSASSLSEGLTWVARQRAITAREYVLDRARLLLVEHMLMAAARRTVNCGAHYRSDAVQLRSECACAGATA